MKNSTNKMRGFITILTGLLVTVNMLSQDSGYSSSPLDAKFVTEDVDRFWKAFDAMDEIGPSAFADYIKEGTMGLQGFIAYRIINADSLYIMVKRYPDAYLKRRAVLNDLDSKKKQIKSIYAAMKYWYPYAKFPPIYFVVGRFNSGGTSSDAGLILGAEMQENLDRLPGLVAHELIHFQQRTDFEKTNILTQSLREGSADFIGELISGGNINLKTYEYAEKNEAALKKEFVEVMHNEDFTDWLYGTSGKDDRPNDLGYWMGYKIAQAYFENQPDRHAAIHEMLFLSDPYEFLLESGYLSEELTAVATSKNMTLEEYINSLYEN